MKKARIVLLLRPWLPETFISVNGRSMPYKSIEIKQEYKKTTVRLTRNINDEGYVTDELLANPIIEEYEADPLVVITSSAQFVPHQDFNPLNSLCSRDYGRLDPVISSTGDLK